MQFVDAAFAGAGGAGLPLAMPAVGAAAAWLAAAAVVDARHHRLPDRLLAGVVLVAWTPVAAAIAVAAFGGTPLRPWSMLAVPIGGLGGGVPLLVVHVRRGVGLGDVKYGAAMGMAGGLLDMRIGLVAVGIAALAAGATGAVLGIRRMPLGPWLATAWAAVFLVTIVRPWPVRS